HRRRALPVAAAGAAVRAGRVHPVRAADVLLLRAAGDNQPGLVGQHVQPRVDAAVDRADRAGPDVGPGPVRPQAAHLPPQTPREGQGLTGPAAAAPPGPASSTSRTFCASSVGEYGLARNPAPACSAGLSPSPSGPTSPERNNTFSPGRWAARARASSGPFV